MKRQLIALCSAAVLLFNACSSQKELTTLKVGASPAPHAQILESCRDALAKEGYQLEIVEFTDYVQPNLSLSSGDLDANYFQHTPYLEEFCESRDLDLSAAAKIHFEPLGIYKGTCSDLSALEKGATIAVPNDPTNEARALQLLAANGLLTLKEDAGLEATVLDIVENPYELTFTELEAAQLPRVLPDIDLAVINGNYALDAGITDSLLLTEDPASDAAQRFANVIAVRTGDEETPAIKALVKALTSDETRTFLEETYGSTVVPVF